ncbi:MAG: tetratricopeptide repeat protein [Treponema sp.]|nr:tetratricopeptide repeat protein [Treponema sp.]
MKSKMKLGFVSNGLIKLACFLCILLLPVCVSAASKKDAEVVGTSIPVPESIKSKSRVSFSDIKPRIIDLIEDGSPRSLEVAARLLHRSDVSTYTDNEKLLLQVCSTMMEYCWPSYKVSWTCPELKGSNYYTNVIFSVRNGMYEAPKADGFIANVLPCVSLFSAPKDTSSIASIKAVLEKALETRSNSTIANYMMATILQRQGKPSKAMSYVKRALVKDSSNKDMLAFQMMLYSSLGKYDEALGVGEKILSCDPQNIVALEICCDVYRAKGEIAKAGDLAAQILMLDSRKVKYLLVRSEAVMATGDYVKASTMLDAYSRTASKEKDYYLLKSRLQLEWNKSPAAAAETLGQALLQYPDDSDIMLAAARTASEGDMKLAGKTALEFIRRILKKDKGNVEATKLCIAELAKESSYEEAYELSSSFVANDSSIAHIHIGICLELGKFEEAKDMATSLYSRNRSDLDAQKSYIKVLVATGRKAEAQGMIAALMEGADSSMKSFLYYEQSFLSVDDKDAVAMLRSSLTQNPRNTDSLTRLYEIYSSKKDWKRAQYYIRQVVALNPNNKKALAMSQKLSKEMNN